MMERKDTLLRLGLALYHESEQSRLNRWDLHHVVRIDVPLASYFVHRHVQSMVEHREQKCNPRPSRSIDRNVVLEELVLSIRLYLRPVR